MRDLVRTEFCQFIDQSGRFCADWFVDEVLNEMNICNLGEWSVCVNNLFSITLVFGFPVVRDLLTEINERSVGI